MFKLKKYLNWIARSLVILTLLGGACSDTTLSHPSVPHNTRDVLKEFVNSLNNAELDTALTFCSENGEVEVFNAPYLQYSQWNNIRQPAYVQSVIYKGQDRIKAYLLSLINNQLQSQTDDMERVDNRIKWAASVSFYGSKLEMSFEGTIDGDTTKISHLDITYGDLPRIT